MNSKPTTSARKYGSWLFGATVLAMLTAAYVSVVAAPPPRSLAEDLVQRPPAATASTPPNMVLIMDDSESMMGDFLPPAPEADWSPHFFPDFMAIPNNSGSTTLITSPDIVWRNSFLNQLAYNPAITYKPWNDNNKAAADNFPNSRIGTYVGPTETDVINTTRVDMRFKIEGGVKVEYLPETAPGSTIDLFVRKNEREGPCIRREPQTRTICEEYGTPVWVPDPNTESGGFTEASCLRSRTIVINACVESSELPGLVEARYYRFEGSDPAQLTDPTKYRLIEIERSAAGRTYPTPIDPYTNKPVERADCAARTVCTFQEEAQNYANYFTYYRTRLFAAIAVTSQVLVEVDDRIRLGFGRLNYFPNGPQMWESDPTTKPPATLPALDGAPHPGHIVRGVRPFTVGSPERQELFTFLFGLNGRGATPIREAMDAVGKYYSRTDARGPWAQNPGTGDPPGSQQLACRRNFSLIATDGAWTNSPNHPQISNLYPSLPARTPAESDGALGPIISGNGLQAGKVYQYNPSLEPPFGTGPGQSQTLTDVAMYYWYTDLRPDLPNVNRPQSRGTGTNYPSDFSDPATWQNMSNFIVGYGVQPTISISSAETAVQNNTAFPWPTVNVDDPFDDNKTSDAVRAALASRGGFYNAVNPVELAASLKAVFAAATAKDGSSTAIAVSSSVITKADDLAFVASYDTNSWAGKLRAVRAQGLVGGTSAMVWSAQFPSNFNDRKIVTTTNKNTAIDFKWATLPAAAQASIGAEGIFAYIIGDRSAEAPAGSLRTRDGLLGSIVNSGPVYSGATHYGYQNLPGVEGASYANYLQHKRSSARPPVVLVGSNEGMFHIFDAANGMEQFAFIPRAAQPLLAALARPNYTHRYLVDGLISEGDAYVSGGWKTFALGSGGAGPKSLFVLDISQPNAMTTAQIKWDITEVDEPDLGHVLGGGTIGRLKNGQWVVIVGNGYESKDHKSVLLIFDLLTGNLLRKIDTGIGVAVPKSGRNGMGPFTPIYDSTRSIVGGYAGDKQGNLWRFDLSDTLPANWKITTSGGALTQPVFVALDAANKPQPITTAPRVTNHPSGGLYVVFGTGKAMETGDELDTSVQAVYGIRDSNNGGPYLKTSMKQLTLVSAGTDMRQLQGTSGPSGLDWGIHKGWYFNLTVSGQGGERVIASPRLSGGMLTVATYNPDNSDPCEVGGSSFVYQLDLANNFTRNPFPNQPPNVVAMRSGDGTRAAMVSLYAPSTTSVNPVNAISLDELKTAIRDTRYSMSAGVLTNNGGSAICTSAGVSINNSTISIPTACAGTTPLRVWRDLR